MCFVKETNNLLTNKNNLIFTQFQFNYYILSCILTSY